jgi:hypothetical protein
VADPRVVVSRPPIEDAHYRREAGECHSNFCEGLKEILVFQSEPAPVVFGFGTAVRPYG